MRNTTGLLLWLALAMGSGTAAADPRSRIAYDDCYIDYWNDDPRTW